MTLVLQSTLRQLVWLQDNDRVAPESETIQSSNTGLIVSLVLETLVVVLSLALVTLYRRVYARMLLDALSFMLMNQEEYSVRVVYEFRIRGVVVSSITEHMAGTHQDPMRLEPRSNARMSMPPSMITGSDSGVRTQPSNVVSHTVIQLEDM